MAVVISTFALVARAAAQAIPVRDESVDLIVTSPPYFGQRAYHDGGSEYEGQIGAEPTPQEFLSALWMVMHECWRVLKPEGVMFVNLGDKRSGSGAPGTTSGLSGRRTTGKPVGLPGAKAPMVQGDRFGGRTEAAKRRDDTHAATNRPSERKTKAYVQAAYGRPKSKQLLPHRFAIGCEDGLADPDGIGWIVRQDMVWAKPNGMPESVTDRTRDNHEYWFHLTKQGDYFSAIDEIRGPVSDYSRPNRAIRTRAPGQTSLSFDDTVNPAGVLPSAVWEIPTQPLVVPAYLGIEHFAAFPTEWPRRLVLAFCPEGGSVLDPFGGTGTTAMVARALGRTGYSFDLSTDYCRLARWRIFQSGHNAKIESRTNGDRQGVML